MFLTLPLNMVLPDACSGRYNRFFILLSLSHADFLDPGVLPFRIVG